MLVGGEEAMTVLKTATVVSSVPLLVIFVMMMYSFIQTLNKDRLKLQRRADKYKEIERRSLRITQIGEKKQDDIL